jgi:hypothetical protein
MIYVLLVLMLFVGVSPVVAATGNDHQVITGPASFFIPAGQCSLLPDGVSVEGSGESVAIVNSHTLPDGSTVYRVNNLIKGTATDSNGGVHKFVYHNSSTQTVSPSGDSSISMNDTFELTGPGPHYSVGFNWRWTFPGTDLVFPPQDNFVNLHGEVALVVACDPL